MAAKLRKMEKSLALLKPSLKGRGDRWPISREASGG